MIEEWHVGTVIGQRLVTGLIHSSLNVRAVAGQWLAGLSRSPTILGQRMEPISKTVCRTMVVTKSNALMRILISWSSTLDRIISWYSATKCGCEGTILTIAIKAMYFTVHEMGHEISFEISSQTYSFDLHLPKTLRVLKHKYERGCCLMSPAACHRWCMFAHIRIVMRLRAW